jgi:hypothetical protein
MIMRDRDRQYGGDPKTFAAVTFMLAQNRHAGVRYSGSADSGFSSSRIAA